MVDPERNQRLGRFVETPVAGEMVRAFVPPPLPPAPPIDVLALLDRNFQGFGKELFTDAGKYVVHFGEKPAQVGLSGAWDIPS